MSELFSPPPLPLASIIPFFQILLTLSFLVVLIVVARLYQGIRILNARVDILSTIVKNLRTELEQISSLDEVAYDEFDAFDAQLQSQLKGDFSMHSSSPSIELKPRRGRDLVRSSIDLDAISSEDASDQSDNKEAGKLHDEQEKAAPPAPKELESYEAKESGLSVDVKSDLSYIATPDGGGTVEPIPPAAALPDDASPKEKEKS